ncbi:Fusaric acid resistance protein-like-domain-containing protein [Radiomyces spectabilis]|uniref:Fusaric acid resistance protein-like-domain-containing protein n=1 Tax=Radiomyces spectabilis TaxID=64574 RepID=UPI00221E7960|nr:Fusaric acid resistance protein-like-domain-containing protein [Radiomyces spectabilis]KAI8376126.1 Fusaric acid resistance protein-like-domain-containing protein [Radiomyces spectabilis]
MTVSNESSPCRDAASHAEERRPLLEGNETDCIPTNAYISTTSSSTPAGWWAESASPLPVGSLESAGYFRTSPPNYYGSLTSSYFDNMSPYDVVLDDGTQQKRSVSLSTMAHITRATTTGNGDSNRESPRLSDTPPPHIPKEDDDSSSDSDDSIDNRSSSKWSFLAAMDRCRNWTLSPAHKKVLKCSMAYMIGSLFTFVPILNQAIGGSCVASHMAATVTVFFSPAKSVGGMIEAAGFGWVYVLSAFALCLASMATTDYFMDHHMYVASCMVTLCVWLAGSTFVIAFLKARVNSPSINTASSLAFLILFSILVREGSWNRSEFDTTKIEATFALVAIGTVISVAVCLLVWPISATQKLKSDIHASLESVRVLLKLLTKTFLLDADLPEFTANTNLKNAITAHSSSFVALKVSLQDAKREFYNLQVRQHAEGYEAIVSSLQRLAQHIGGLRSSCGLQFEVMREKASKPRPAGVVMQYDPEFEGYHPSDKKQTWNVKTDRRRKRLEQKLRREQTLMDIDGYLQEEKETDRLGVADRTDRSSPAPPAIPARVKRTTEEPAETKRGPISQFIRTMRPPMKSLAYTCKHTIVHLQTRLKGQADSTTPSFEMMRRNLAMAIVLFESSQQQALARMYHRKKKEMNLNELHSRLMKQFPAEDVFLVYFFVFCLLEFAKELMDLVGHVQTIDHLGPVKYPWLSGWRVYIARCCGQRTRSSEETNGSKKNASFRPNDRNTHNTLHTPVHSGGIRWALMRVWGFFTWFRQHTVRYAVKATLTALIFSAPAFIPVTQPWFRTFRMEWMLITIMAVMTPTVGGTNLMAILRVLATIFGCYVGAIAYAAFPGQPVMLFIITGLFSVPSFWMIQNHKHGKFGQFSLLAYNLVVLYTYNHRDETTIDVFSMAWMRCIAVSMGVVIGLIVTTYVWPYEARKEVRKGLSDLLLRMSWLYNQLTMAYAETSEEDHYARLIEEVFELPRREDVISTEDLIEQNKAKAASFQKMELALQLNLLELQGLLVHAPNEPRLKGPFPIDKYQAMLQSCQTILDNFLSMRIVILKDVWALHVRRDFLRPASHEFKMMTGNVLLYFYLLASALQLKTPLPPYLPPAEECREKLMERLQTMPTVMHSPSQDVDTDECYMVYYAYVVLMENIIRELDQVGHHLRELFGSLVPETQWSRCFAG